MGKKKNKKNKKVEMLAKELKGNKVEKVEEETKVEETKITVSSETNKDGDIPSVVVEDKVDDMTEEERKEKFKLVNDLIDELFPEEEVLLKDMVDYNKNRKTYIENKKAFENQYGDKDLFEATSQFFIDEAKKEIEWIESHNKEIEKEKERAKKKTEKAKKKSA